MKKDREMQQDVLASNEEPGVDATSITKETKMPVPGDERRTGAPSTLWAETNAPYYYARTITLPLDEAEAHVREALKGEGFGVLTEIDVQATLHKKLAVDFPPYKILGACNPTFAYQALQAEDKIGTMLPCNVVLQAKDGRTEVAAVDPIASMQAVGNERLYAIAEQVRERLRRVVDQVEGTAGP